MLREFFKYTTSNIMGMIGLSCYVLVDTFFIALGLGSDGLTALNLALPIFSLTFAIGLMLGTGGATQFTILRNQGEKEKSQEAWVTVWKIAVICTIILIFSSIFLTGPLAYMLGARGKIYDMTYIYLHFLLLFAPLFIANNIIQAFVRNDGAPQLAAFAMIGGSVGNIVLDYILIFPMKLGILGAILATVMSPGVSMLIMLPFFLQKKNHFHFQKCRFQMDMLIKVCISGSAAFVSEISTGLVMFVFNIILLRISGNTAVAAYGIIANVGLVLISIYNGVSQGVQPLVSKYFGQGKPDLIHIIVKYAIFMTIGIGIVFYAVMFTQANGIVGIFNTQKNMELQTIAVPGLQIYFSGAIFAGLNILLASILSAMDQGRYGGIISILRGVIVIIPLAFLMSGIWGLTGLWAVFPATEVLVLIYSGYSYIIKVSN